MQCTRGGIVFISSDSFSAAQVGGDVTVAAHRIPAFPSVSPNFSAKLLFHRVPDRISPLKTGMIKAAEHRLMDGRTEEASYVCFLSLAKLNMLFWFRFPSTFCPEMNCRSWVSQLSVHRRIYFLISTGPTWSNDGDSLHPVEPLRFLLDKKGVIKKKGGRVPDRTG